MRADITLLCNVDGGQGVTLTFPALFASLRRVNRGGRVITRLASTTDAVLEGSSATAAPSRSKVVISMASPWNLFDKPAEPSQTGDYSSSSTASVVEVASGASPEGTEDGAASMAGSNDGDMVGSP
jgi:hypothetical protein